MTEPSLPNHGTATLFPYSESFYEVSTHRFVRSIVVDDQTWLNATDLQLIFSTLYTISKKALSEARQTQRDDSSRTSRRKALAVRKRSIT